MKKKQHRDYNQKLSDMPNYLRGFSNNRWGGHKSNKMRGFKVVLMDLHLNVETLLSRLSYKLSIRESMIYRIIHFNN